MTKLPFAAPTTIVIHSVGEWAEEQLGLRGSLLRPSMMWAEYGFIGPRSRPNNPCLYSILLFFCQPKKENT